MQLQTMHLIWADGYGGAERQMALWLEQNPSDHGICFYNNIHARYLGGKGLLMGIVKLLSMASRDRFSLNCWMYRAAVAGAMLKIASAGRIHVSFEIRHGLSGKIKYTRRIMVYAVGFLASSLRIPCTFNSKSSLVNHLRYGYPAAICAVRWNIARRPDIDLQRRTAFRRRMGIPQESYVISSIGRDVPEKNFENALLAFHDAACNHEICYLLVGSGCTKYAGLHTRVFALENVQEIDSVYSASDLIFIPSKVESLSNVLCEAIACGLPIATTLSGDAKLYVEASNYQKAEFGGFSREELTELLRRSLLRFRPQFHT